MDGMDSKSPASGSLKTRILALVAQGEVEQQAFIDNLSDAERAAVGARDAWSARDHIAHNAAWKDDAAQEIAATLRGEVYVPESITTFNPRVFAEQQHQSWDVILAAAEQGYSELRTALEGCSEADLTDPARFPWREGNPLWTTAFVSGYEHPAEHYAQYYVESGKVARATMVRKEAVETARRYIGDRGEFGYMIYNLGCFYANTGQNDLAIATLRESLAGTPRLREWLTEDPELMSLRDDPAFQVLAEG